MAEPRTFKIQSPYMHGDDIREFQKQIKGIARSWDVHIPLEVDGVYGMATRSFMKTICFALGFTHDQLDNGVTPWVRTLTRNPDERSSGMKERQDGRWRKGFRDDLRKKYPKEKASDDTAAPLGKIITMTWGYHPGVHDGIDLICGADAPIYAICDAEVFDVRSGGWWGKAPSGDVARGDGIIQLRCLTNDGPFKVGMHFGYGHAEKAVVHEGQKVQQGQLLGHAGLAVAWHVHFMANGGGTTQGRGDRDPEPYVRYALAHDA
jgi:murein DD-endopeptidase MepM/ murein hydrolase activator NlpD